MNTENKPIVLISTFTRIVKFYNPDSSRNMNHSDGKVIRNFYKIFSQKVCKLKYFLYISYGC